MTISVSKSLMNKDMTKDWKFFPVSAGLLVWLEASDKLPEDEINLTENTYESNQT